MDTQFRPASAPAALADLIAAGLVSHEMIGDPARLGREAEALRVLCGLVAGPIWRIEPFHYAFRAAGGDLSAALGLREPEDRAAALEAALQAELGPEAVWVNATDLLPEDPGAARLFDQPLLLLRAQATAVGGRARGRRVRAAGGDQRPLRRRDRAAGRRPPTPAGRSPPGSRRSRRARRRSSPRSRRAASATRRSPG